MGAYLCYAMGVSLLYRFYRFLASPPALVVFLNAALYFLLEFMAGKWLLPIFGGSWAVWLTVLSFFTTMLLAGYAYAHLLLKQHPHLQLRVHGALLLLALVSVGVGVFAMGGDSWLVHFILELPLPAALHILLLLSLFFGIPAVALAATSTLVQSWTYTNKETYRLYAVSNIGSFVGLLGYPFFFEPLFTLTWQRVLWALGFLFGVGLLFFVMRTYRARQAAHREHVTVSYSMSTYWMLLAAFPALLMAATTAQITHVIAPVPLLWMIPLGLYLLSYVIAFSGRGQGIMVLMLAVVSAWGSLFLLDAGVSEFLLRLFVYGALLFFVALVCHAHLYRLRPSAVALSRFYLAAALGGALGTSFISFASPVLFRELWEFPLAVLVSVVGASALVVYRLLSNVSPWAARVLTIALIFVAGNTFYTFSNTAFGFEGVERNFYGITTVVEGDDRVSLYHEETLHGTQYKDPQQARFPTTYYALHSAVGRSFGYERVVAYPGEPLNIAVIGLGAGTIAAYCERNDTFVFYEIDERMERIARERFTYLAQCPHAEVRLGDARRTMEQEAKSGEAERYDIIFVDAFNDDSIPTHLLTREAIALYQSRMRRDDSIIAIHTSNRYLDLPPLVVALARDAGLAAVVMDSGGAENDVGGSSSEWVLLSKDTNVFTRPLFTEGSLPLPTRAMRLWSDSYSNILPLVRMDTPIELIITYVLEPLLAAVEE